MNDKKFITELTIELPEQTVKLRPDSARKLYEELGKLFAVENKTEIQKLAEQLAHLKDLRPAVHYPPPIVIRERDWEPQYPHWYVGPVTCPSTGTPWFGLPGTTCTSVGSVAINSRS